MENERNDYSELVVTYCFTGLTQKDLQQQRSLQAQLRLIEHEELMREESLIKRRLLNSSNSGRISRKGERTESTWTIPPINEQRPHSPQRQVSSPLFALKKNASIAKALHRPASIDRPPQSPTRSVRSVPAIVRNDIIHSAPLPKIRSPGRPEQPLVEEIQNDSDEEENKVVFKESDESEDAPSFFPLETFDDDTYETKTADEWLQKNKYGGKTRAVSKWFHSSGKWDWRECSVLAYDKDKQKYLIEWDESKKQKYVNRLNLKFDEEDEKAFEKRIQAAIQRRMLSEAMLRRSIRVDMVDSATVPELPQIQIARIQAKIQSKELTPLQLNILNNLMEEVKANYKKTNKRIDYDVKYPLSEEIDENYLETVAKASTLFEESENRDNFIDTLGNVQKTNIMGNQNIIKSLGFLYDNIRKIEQLSLLKTSFTLCSLRESVKDQVSHFNFALDTYKTQIQPTVSSVILTATNNESRESKTAEAPRYQKLLTLINIMENDALCKAILQSITDYASIFRRYGKSVKTHSDHLTSELPSLLKVDLIFENGKLGFSPRLSDFENGITRTIQSLLKAVKEIPSLEVPSIDQKFYSERVTVIEYDDIRIQEHVNHILTVLRTNFASLEKLRSALSTYEDLLCINLPEYMLTYSSKIWSLTAFRADIDKNKKYRETILNSFPRISSLGIFEVDGSSIKDALLQMNENITQYCLEFFRNQAYLELNGIIDRCQEIEYRLSLPPGSPQELVDLIEFIKVVTAEQSTLQQRIDNVIKKYALLEEFYMEVTPEEFEEKWELYGWPKILKRKISDTEKALQLERLRLIRDLRSNQKIIEQTITRLADQVAEISVHKDLEMAITIGDRAKALYQELTETLDTATLYNQHERLFDFEPPQTVTTLNQIMEEFEPMYQFWTTASDWIIVHAQWLSAIFFSLSSDFINKVITNSYRTVLRVSKQLRGRKEPTFTAAGQLKQRIEQFRNYLPIISKLRHPGIRIRHWEMIAKDAGFKLPDENLFTLGFVLSLNLDNYMDSIGKITDVAINEFTLETTLDKMTSDIRSYNLDLTPYGDTNLLAGVDDLYALLDDQLVMLQAMLSSPYIVTFVQKARNWKTTLKSLQELLDEWLTCQQRWLYLAPIFSSEDITRQLPAEGRKFTAVDTTWKKIMTQTKINPKVLVVSAQDRLFKQLSDCNQLLEVILKGLQEYLDRKRASFSRFYFLSNDELLDILSKAKDPASVKPHLRKCFESLVSLKFNQNFEIKSIFSAEGEKVNLAEPVLANKEVEKWLTELESVVKKTLRKLLTRAVVAHSKMTRENWILSWPAQLVLTANQIIFTQLMTKLLTSQDSQELKLVRSKLNEQLNDLSQMQTAEKNVLHKKTLTALLLSDIHNRDIVDRLLELKNASIYDFEWKSLMRFYWEDQSCVIRILNSTLNYGYEYIGNTSRLVVTPATQKIFRSLCSALSLTLSGCVTGNSGTGKTETIKDLAKAVAKQCVVFNCSDQLDYKSLGKMFKGLVSTGSWSCFDEFNRIETGVLSVVSQQILNIQQAIAESLEVFLFEGASLHLDKTCAIFITLNTAKEGKYLLPDSLKSLLRPVALIDADPQYISEIMLYTQGYTAYQDLSRKICSLFKSLSDELSLQSHYDFSLREIKVVLGKTAVARQKSTGLTEDSIVYTCLCDTVLPKLVEVDTPVFQKIINGFFPNVASNYDVNAELVDVIRFVMEGMGLYPHESIIQKCIQLYDIMQYKSAVLIAGPPASGKTTIYKILASAMDRINGDSRKRLSTILLNPKCFNLSELYGTTKSSLQWVDGVLPNILRHINAEQSKYNVVVKEGGLAESPSLQELSHYANNTEPGTDMPRSESVYFTIRDAPQSYYWIIFDGPIDSRWIETMNSTFDDNKLLCLTNGERIPVPPTVNFLMESVDLTHASPATISRLGIVYMNNTLPNSVLIKSWISKLPSEIDTYIPFLEKLISDVLEDMLTSVRRDVKDCQVKLERAKRLIGGLGGESSRWDSQSKLFRESQNTLVGDVLLSSIFIVYFGPFSPHYRSRALAESQWKLRADGIRFSEPFSFSAFMGNPITIRKWHSLGLPSGNTAVENAILSLEGKTWPLIIDPQGQALDWISNMEKENKLVVTSFNQPDFIRTLESSIHFGTPLILENMEQELDPIIDPILLHEEYRLDGRLVIKLRDKFIPYNENFKLYMITKQASPALTPQVAAKVNVINFSITSTALQEQILHTVVKLDREELYLQRVQLTSSMDEAKKELQEIEDRILYLLNNIEGDILDDELMIDTLSASKAASLEINSRLLQSETTEMEISKSVTKYQPVAARVNFLYFALADLMTMNEMYRYSLQWFTDLFTKAFQKVNPNYELQKRIDIFNEEFTYLLYSHISKGILEKDKLLFAFMVAVAVLQGNNNISSDEWKFFLAGTKNKAQNINPQANSISESAWNVLNELPKIHSNYEKIRDAAATLSPSWKSFLEIASPYSDSVVDFTDQLSSFQRLTLVRFLRPDKLISSIQLFIQDQLGEKYLAPPMFDLSHCYQESSISTPILLVLSPGTSPTEEIFSFAAKNDMQRKVYSISLGQDQGSPAEKLIEIAIDRGNWVLIQNCHLDTKWLLTLEKIVRELPLDRVHNSFRLWLTTNPTDKFPVGLLQSSVKMTVEPPQGIRGNLQRTFMKIGAERIDIIAEHPWHSKLLFGICFLHAIISERKKFGFLGWNRTYEFNLDDIMISVKQFEVTFDTRLKHIRTPSSSLLQLLQYTVADCFYGGKIQDRNDYLTLETIVSEFFADTYEKNNDTVLYKFPEKGGYAQFMDTISRYPLNDTTEIFGLNSNAENIDRTMQAENLIKSLSVIHPSISQPNQKIDESLVLDVFENIQNTVLSVWKLPSNPHSIDYIGKPLGPVLYQDITAYAKLINIIKATISHIQSAIKGQSIMSAEYEKAMKDIHDNVVPEIWRKASYISERPLSMYIKDLGERITFLNDWVFHGEPITFWLAATYHPKMLLGAVIQRYAHKQGILADTVAFRAEETYSRSGDGISVSGLVIVGASWDRKKKQIQDAKELIAEMPVLRLIPVSKDEIQTNTFSCPLYITTHKTNEISGNFITHVVLPTTVASKFWILRGVALYCQHVTL